MLQINSDPIGKGQERACYVHPEDPRKAIKISPGQISAQSRREIRFYRSLQKRGGVIDKHIPNFFGLCDTNLGPGIVVDLIRNYDGEISRPLNWYLAQGFPIGEFEPYLDELKNSFLQNLIIFNRGLTIGSLVVQKSSAIKVRLVAINGLGESIALGWPDLLPFLARRKIQRRWARFITGLYRTQEVRSQLEAPGPGSAPTDQP